MKETHIAKIILIWIIMISVNLYYFSQNSANKSSSFYNIGPNENLIILDIVIDTKIKYMFVVFYSLLNNIIRNMNTNILRSWITHNIQDNTKEALIRKRTLNYMEAYEINTIYSLYQWVDFLIYIHLLLSQIDIFLIEATSDVLVVSIITHSWYLSNNKYETIDENIDDEIV
jgi:hypothetical protein